MCFFCNESATSEIYTYCPTLALHAALPIYVVGVSSQAAGHKTLVHQLIEELKAAGAGDILVVCGGVIPPQDHAFLHDPGVVAAFGPGNNIPPAAGQASDRIRTQYFAARPNGPRRPSEYGRALRWASVSP